MWLWYILIFWHSATEQGSARLGPKLYDTHTYTSDGLVHLFKIAHADASTCHIHEDTRLTVLKGNLFTTISACGVYWRYYNEAADSATLFNSTVQPHAGTLYHKQCFSEARKGNSWAKVRKWEEKKLQYVSEPSMKPVGKKPRHHPRMSWYQKPTMTMMLCIDLTWVTPCQHSPKHYVNSPLNPYPFRGEESLKFWLITWL